MKRIFLLSLIILFILVVFKIPEYRELNSIKIIESIGYDCLNDKVYLKDIIPEKDDSGIEYKYKIHYTDKVRLVKTVHFILYFLHKIPFTTCPIPYAKKKNVGTMPASALLIP